MGLRLVVPDPRCAASAPSQGVLRIGPSPRPRSPIRRFQKRKDFVVAVADKMPMWDADAISKYERVEIATVKADIAMAQQSEEEGPFLEYVSKLHDDWDALVALDEMLKKESLT